MWSTFWPKKVQILLASWYRCVTEKSAILANSDKVRLKLWVNCKVIGRFLNLQLQTVPSLAPDSRRANDFLVNMNRFYCFAGKQLFPQKWSFPLLARFFVKILWLEMDISKIKIERFFLLGC